MALASLRWDSSKDVEETKGGMYIYDGSTHNFHEWEFRTEVRWESTKVEDLKKTMSKSYWKRKKIQRKSTNLEKIQTRIGKSSEIQKETARKSKIDN